MAASAPPLVDPNSAARLREVLDAVDLLMKENNALMATLQGSLTLPDPTEALDWPALSASFRAVMAGFDAVLKYAQAACGRDASLLHASTERVVSSLGRRAAAGIPTTHLMLFPRAVTEATAKELPSLLAAAVAPEIHGADARLAADARAEGLSRDPAAAVAELMHGLGHVRAIVAHLTSTRAEDRATGEGVLSARGGGAGGRLLASIQGYRLPHERKAMEVRAKPAAGARGVPSKRLLAAGQPAERTAAQAAVAFGL